MYPLLTLHIQPSVSMGAGLVVWPFVYALGIGCLHINIFRNHKPSRVSLEHTRLTCSVVARSHTSLHFDQAQRKKGRAHEALVGPRSKVNRLARAQAVWPERTVLEESELQGLGHCFGRKAGAVCRLQQDAETEPAGCSPPFATLQT